VQEIVEPEISVSASLGHDSRAERVGRFVVRRSYSAALLTLAAAAIHFATAPEHFETYVPYGVFFLCLGVAQAGLAVALLVRPSRRLFAGAAIGTLAVIGLYVASRTTGLPIAPQPWRPEPVGFVDVVCTLLEAVAVPVFLVLLWRPGRRRGRVRVALTTLPAFLFSGLTAFAGVGAALTPMEEAFSVAPPAPGSISVASLKERPGSEPVRSFTLTAAVTNVAGGQAWTFNGTLPGPELRVKVGDRVRATLVNHLPEATSIHWHGLVLPNAEDGVAGVTQNAVAPGASHTYEFVAREPGTYWYHAHQKTNDQIPRGLLGALIIQPWTVTETRDYSLLIHTLPGGASIAINGTANPHLDANPGDTVRLRLINGAQPDLDKSMVQAPVLLGAPYRISALDGHDLNQPGELGPQQILLGMGQRADLVFTMPAGGAVRLAGIKGAPAVPLFGAQQGTASVTVGEGPAPAANNVSSLPRFDLTRYGQPLPDPVAGAAGSDVTQEIVLSAAGPVFRRGTLDGIDTFNGLASPQIPPIHVREGQLVRLRIVNVSNAAYHTIHIHGHVFSIVARNGHPLAGSPVHVDGVLVGPHEIWDVAFRADNPGIWMLHCHVLVHAAGGMSMTVNYEGISTPFTMGRRSGNEPE
jgi:FtsP/CotA-like multicopper oxidase with cupredoxin domain